MAGGTSARSNSGGVVSVALKVSLWTQLQCLNKEAHPSNQPGPYLPLPQREYFFHPQRLWRFDYAWPTLLLAVEIDGAVYTQGRHTRGSGFEEDCVKINEATLLGWRVLRFTTGQVNSGYALCVIERALRWSLGISQ